MIHRRTRRYVFTLMFFLVWNVNAATLVKKKPEGAFTLTFSMWIKYKPALKDIQKMVLLKQNRCVLSLIKSPGSTPGNERFLLKATVNGISFKSCPYRFRIETWYRIAFMYDGKSTGTISVNDNRLETELSSEPVDKISSTDQKAGIFATFSGLIDQLSIRKGITPPSMNYTFVKATKRTSFLRMEKTEGVKLMVKNRLSVPIQKAGIVSVLKDEKGRELDKKSFQLPELAGKAECSLIYPLNTHLKAGNYFLEVQIFGPDNTAFSIREKFPLVIAPRPLSAFPVIMYDGPENIMEKQQLHSLKDLGFTMGCMQPRKWVNLAKIWKDGATSESAGPEGVEWTKRILNYALANQYKVSAYLRSTYPRHFPGEKGKYCTFDRDGKPQPDSLSGLSKKMQDYSYNVGASIARTYGNFPGLGIVLINDETIDFGIIPDFSKKSQERYKKTTGRYFPIQISGKRAKMGGMDYLNNPACPFNRAVPDDNPVLAFCRWFWKDPNGQITLINKVVEGLESTGVKSFWSWYAPAVRYPYCYGSGGNVDVIAEWTYSNPNPLKFGAKADELLAMQKGGKPGQKAVLMTQCFWYRSKVAPRTENKIKNVEKARWEKNKINTGARFITISPDHLREAFWLNISRPIQGIAYYGWSSLAGPPGKDYAFTNPETKETLKELTHKVIQPLGPSLLQIPDYPVDVALLESFTSQVLQAGKSVFTMMQTNIMYHIILQYAQLQPEIIYEETILKKGLDSYNVLVMPCCEILPESIVEKIKEFQTRGGIVISNVNLCPAIKPDIELLQIRRKWDARKDKKTYQNIAAEIRKQLDPFYVHPADSSNPDVITRLRRYKNTDFLFVMNDKRKFGDYVGQYRKVMEAGVPVGARVSVKKNNSGHVYNLLKGEKVQTISDRDRVTFDVTLPPGGGGVYMITDKDINNVTLSVPQKAKVGENIQCKINLLDSSGKTMTGTIIPLQIRILDQSSKEIEGSGFYAVKDGTLTIQLDIPRNEFSTQWKIIVRELASHKNTSSFITIIPSTPTSN